MKNGEVYKNYGFLLKLDINIKIIPVVTDRSAILKIPVLNIPPKFMYKKSVTDPNTILSKIFAIPPPIINEKPIIDNLSNDLSMYVYKVIDIKTITGNIINNKILGISESSLPIPRNAPVFSTFIKVNTSPIMLFSE